MYGLESLKLAAVFKCLVEADVGCFISVFSRLPNELVKAKVLFNFVFDDNAYTKILDGFISFMGGNHKWYSVLMIMQRLRFDQAVTQVVELIKKHKSSLWEFAIDFFIVELPITAIAYSRIWDDMLDIFFGVEIVKEILSVPTSLTGLYSCSNLCMESQDLYPSFYDEYTTAFIAWLDGNPSNFALDVDRLDEHFSRFINTTADILFKSGVQWRDSVEGSIIRNMPLYWGWVKKGYDINRERHYLFVPISLVYICATTRGYIKTKEQVNTDDMRWYLNMLIEWIPENLTHSVDLRLGRTLVRFVADFDNALDSELIDFFNVIVSPDEFSYIAHEYCIHEKASVDLKQHIDAIWRWKRNLLDPDIKTDREAIQHLDSVLCKRKTEGYLSKGGQLK